MIEEEMIEKGMIERDNRKIMEEEMIEKGMIK